MYIIEEINIRSSIVHILDNQLTVPVLSQDEAPSGMDMKSYFAGHILKIINNDAMKECVFEESKEYNKFKDLIRTYYMDEISMSFVKFSKTIAKDIFEIMSTHTMIPPADLVVCQFNLMTKPHIIIMKMDYQSTYTHFTDYEAAQNVNTIMEYKTTLPGPKQRVSEAIVINLTDMQVKVLEKKHELDGCMDYYLSKLFMKCSTKLSSKDQLKIVKQTTEFMAKKFFEHDPEKQAAMKQNLYEHIEDNGTIDLEKYAEKTFDGQEEVKEKFIQKLERKGLQEAAVQLEEKTIENAFAKQTMKTDNGIEIKIPMHLYNDKKAIEIVTGADGKLSIVIKDVSKILA